MYRLATIHTLQTDDKPQTQPCVCLLSVVSL